MKIKWGIDDGFVNRRPDWTLEIPDIEIEDFAQDLAEDYRTVSDIEDDLYEQVQDAMLQKVSTYISNIKDVLAEIERRAEELKENSEED